MVVCAACSSVCSCMWLFGFFWLIFVLLLSCVFLFAVLVFVGKSSVYSDICCVVFHVSCALGVVCCVLCVVCVVCCGLCVASVSCGVTVLSSVCRVRCLCCA